MSKTALDNRPGRTQAALVIIAEAKGVGLPFRVKLEPNEALAAFVDLQSACRR